MLQFAGADWACVVVRGCRCQSGFASVAEAEAEVAVAGPEPAGAIAAWQLAVDAVPAFVAAAGWPKMSWLALVQPA